ncbi:MULTISPECIES: DNA phosphorothioation-dependent restriction protein DptF [Staphylococcus]|uniref:DNA phosphorothioation-dependent restriction protein DptF n=1 Tax=Staphylococcus TaxID=1279 RepID=UPI00050FFE8E|nr:MULTISPECIES: DNA phosphorothioation-dependent restriction protein DptF [Staphylococcus]KGF25962.1 DNA-binding protein [Staphylococcus haemolyticus DNF00585]OFL87390.1 DNA phosphorothioation-dependent restriction protein DptF [Staphylococcus sp. HMSC069D12]
MKLEVEIKNKIFKILKELEINLNFLELSEINLKELRSEIFKLRSKKYINNTAYELLRSISNEIEDIQMFDSINSYKKLNELLINLERYISIKSDITTNKFLQVISNLSSSSKESIVNTEEFNYFNEYLHIHRRIEDRLKEALVKLKNENNGIIFLVGSVGDGKSHLLSYLNKNNKELFQNVYIYNDATESNNPYKTAVETLVEKLRQYEKKEINKMVIAINVGMLNNLSEYLISKNIDLEIVNTIKKSEVFSNKGMETTTFKLNNISLVSFLNETTFEIENEIGIKSDFYNSIFRKIFKKEVNNPFYKAFIEDDGFNRNEPIYQNYSLILDESVQNTIKYLIIKTQIVNKRIISTRALLNFIYDIIVPEMNQKSNDSFLVNLLFGSNGKSAILTSMHEQDPIFFQNSKLDKLNIELFNTLDLQAKCEEIFGVENYKKIANYLYLLNGLEHKRKFEMIIRLHYLFNYEEYEPTSFKHFIRLLREIENNKTLKKEILNKVINGIIKWKGSPYKNYIYNESLKPETKVRIGLEFKPKPKSVEINGKNNIVVKLEINNAIYEIEIDFNLYNLLEEVENGYVIKEKDKIDALVFTEFVDNIVNNLTSTESTIVNIPSTNETYMIRDEFLGYQLEEVE